MKYITTAERIGIEKGRIEGGKDKAQKTALNLLSLGILTEEQIAHATELSIEDIRKFKKHLNDPSE